MAKITRSGLKDLIKETISEVLTEDNLQNKPWVDDRGRPIKIKVLDKINKLNFGGGDWQENHWCELPGKKLGIAYVQMMDNELIYGVEEGADESSEEVLTTSTQKTIQLIKDASKKYNLSNDLDE